MDDKLMLEDLARLMDKLHDVQTKWYSIGLQLGMAVADLEATMSQSFQNDQDSLRSMLIKWLKSGKATISALCTALRKKSVGEDIFADDIEKSWHGKRQHSPPSTSPPPAKKSKSLEVPKKPAKKSTHAATQGTQDGPIALKSTAKQASSTETAKKSTLKEKNLLGVPESFGGEDFIRTQPPDRLCVKCNRVPLNPQRSVCCNRLYCKPCANKTKKCNNKKHNDDLEYTPDKKLYNNIQKLKIKCKNREKGCQWEGLVFNLKNHLPECPHEPPTPMNSRNKTSHLKSEPSPLTLSSSTTSTSTSTNTNTVSAPSNTFPQQTARLHQLPSNSSPVNEVPSSSPSQTSALPLLFGQIASASYSTHSHSSDFKKNIIKFEDSGVNSTANTTPPVHLVMTNVSEIQQASIIWVSQSFLSHQLGYRMHLAVHIGRDNQLRIGVTLNQGQQNTFLRFPCSGHTIVRVMDPHHSKLAVEVKVPFTLGEGDIKIMPVLTSQCDVSSDLVTRNCLFFQVSRIYLDYECQPWLLGPNYKSTN